MGLVKTVAAALLLIVGPTINFHKVEANQSNTAVSVDRDTKPPLITVAASPALLWQPNGSLVQVTVAGCIKDESGIKWAGIPAASVRRRRERET
jgi:hypothetical protein